MSNSILNSVNSEGGTIVYLKNSNITLINNFTISDTIVLAFRLESSYATSIESLRLIRWEKWFYILLSSIGILKSSTFESGGISRSIFRGAIYSEFSNFTLTNSSFTNNLAINGPAISVIWTSKDSWDTTIINNTFQNNKAISKGGAIYYNLNRPIMSDNIFINNSAAYGQNIGSYPIRIVVNSTRQGSAYLRDVGSGIEYNDNLIFALVDHDDQTMILDNESTFKVSPISLNSSLTGTDYAKVNKGVASFSGLTFNSKPGDQNVTFRMTSKSINTHFDFTIDFRYCKPGEFSEKNGKWGVCPYKFYSLKWNESQWYAWMNNAVCLGGKDIEVDNGYWRKTPNSTDIIEWPRKDSCLGKYVKDSENPSEWAAGYTGLLCTDCSIRKGIKYQPLSNFEWSKWPNPILNVIRVAGAITIALMFISAIVVVNIRKKKENNISVLLRIFTNYVQLMTSSLSFNSNLPQTFTKVFSTSGKVSSPQESFFSFDWFIRDSELKLFAPNNNIFKLLLFLLLPLFLMLFYVIIFVIYQYSLKMMKSQKQIDLKRYWVVTLIVIIFIFHPRMSTEAITLLQWEKVDKGEYRMRNYLEYVWYSSDHLKWIAIITLPMMIFWIIGSPLFALIVLIKYRHKLDDIVIKKYFLLIYQGLKPNRFYWEFVNTLRKLVILSINVLLFQFNPEYRILLGISNNFYLIS